MDDIAIKTTVGIEESESLYEIKIYPNPTFDFIYLKTKKPEDFKVSISSVEGRVIMEKIINNAVITKINVSTLPKGLYFITIEDKNNRKKVSKLIVE